MKKRTVAILLALLLFCTSTFFSGCQKEEPSPFEVINEAMENSRKLDSIAVKMEMDISMSADGISMEIPLTADVKAKDLNTQSPILHTTLTTSVFGISMDIEMYQENGYAYFVTEDMSYKASIADFDNEYDFTGDINNMLQELPEELFDGLELVTNDDKSQTITLSIPEETFAQIYEDYIKGIDESTDIAGVKILDTSVKITVANGYIQSMDMDFGMEMDASGVKTASSVKASITYLNPGEPVTITPPEGYQDFGEL